MITSDKEWWFKIVQSQNKIISISNFAIQLCSCLWPTTIRCWGIARSSDDQIQLVYIQVIAKGFKLAILCNDFDDHDVKYNETCL